MAKVAAKTSVVAKLKKKGLSKIHEAHKEDPLKLGPINLPAGITNGVAKLVVAEIKEHEDGDNKGEPYASFQGIVRFPDAHNGVQIKNQRATLFIPLYDTPKRKNPKTFEDHYADFLNELRKFGIETAELEADDLESTLETLVEEEPNFNFTTRGWTPPKTKQDPNPDEMVFTEFRGINETFVDDTDPDAGVAEDDEEADDEEEEETPKKKVVKDVPKSSKPAKKAPKKAEPEEEEEEESSVSVGDTGTAPYDGEDFNVVVDAVEGDTLTVHNADDDSDVWDVEVSEFTPDGDEAEEEEEADDEEEVEIIPEVGDILKYNDEDVEITKVFAKKRTVNCTEVESEEEHTGVSWDDLVIEEEE